VLYLPPLAEELNSSRRTVAQQARALARAGFAVLQIDLLGCGDSSGRLEDARWSDWLHDARAALDWLA
jgi:alpha-beta hydrolase superfamily lysophospholipase